jgi:uncharacterized membrane protein
MTQSSAYPGPNVSQAQRDRIDAGHDYQVNLKAELEIMMLHEKMDALRDQEIKLLHQRIAELQLAIAGLSQAKPTT